MENSTSAATSSHFSDCGAFIGEFYSKNPSFDKYYELYIFLIVVNLISALTAMFGNSVIIAGIILTPSLRRTPSYWLICCQVFNDLALGLTQPVISTLLILSIADLAMYMRAVCILGQISLFLCFFLLSATGCCLTAISVDRLLAIRLKTTYRTTVSSKRVAVVISALWVFSLALAVIAFIIDDYKYVTIMLFCFASSVSTITFACYTSAIKALKTHIKDVNPTQTNSNKSPIDVLKYKKSVWTMIILEVLLMLCGIPICTSWIYVYVHGLTLDSTTLLFTSTTVLNLVSSINPLIFVSRMNDIKTASKNVLKKICCMSRNE